MKATIVETFRWSGSSKLRGMVLDADEGVRLPGMVTVDLDKVDAAAAAEHYLTSYVTHSKVGAPVHTPHNTLVTNPDGSNTTYGPWADVDRQELIDAILEATKP